MFNTLYNIEYFFNLHIVSVKVLNLYTLKPIVCCLLNNWVGQINSDITDIINNCIKLNINIIEKNSAEEKKEKNEKLKLLEKSKKL